MTVRTPLAAIFCTDLLVLDYRIIVVAHNPMRGLLRMRRFLTFSLVVVLFSHRDLRRYFLLFYFLFVYQLHNLFPGCLFLGIFFSFADVVLARLNDPLGKNGNYCLSKKGEKSRLDIP